MSQSSKPVDTSMVTCTFVFIEDGHYNKSVVTAGTEKDVIEKYFLKYPERRGYARLTMYDGDGDDVSWVLKRKDES